LDSNEYGDKLPGVNELKMINDSMHVWSDQARIKNQEFIQKLYNRTTGFRMNKIPILQNCAGEK
jgi:PhoPQ-activated pathogenicity-related protein